MQPALSGNVLRKKFHLIGKYAAVGENEVLGAVRYVRQIQKLHAGELGRTVALPLVTGATRRDDVHPHVLAPFREGFYMVAREARTLVQVSIDGTVPPMPFNQIQCADLQNWDGAIEAAKAVVRTAVGNTK